MKTCKYCGARIRDDDVFCYLCGKEYVEPNSNLTKCKFCGKKLYEGAKYCLYCGEPIYGGKNPYKDYSKR